LNTGLNFVYLIEAGGIITSANFFEYYNNKYNVSIPNGKKSWIGFSCIETLDRILNGEKIIDIVKNGKGIISKNNTTIYQTSNELKYIDKKFMFNDIEVNFISINEMNSDDIITILDIFFDKSSGISNIENKKSQIYGNSNKENYNKQKKVRFDESKNNTKTVQYNPNRHIKTKDGIKSSVLYDVMCKDIPFTKYWNDVISIASENSEVLYVDRSSELNVNCSTLDNYHLIRGDPDTISEISKQHNIRLFVRNVFNGNHTDLLGIDKNTKIVLCINDTRNTDNIENYLPYQDRITKVICKTKTIKNKISKKYPALRNKILLI
jgi:hypothetical protein